MLPVEVAVFGYEAQERFLLSLGCVPKLRRSPDGVVFVTDNGNYIYDCRFEGIPDPLALERALEHRAGVVGSGLFLGLATAAFIADESRVEERRRQQQHRGA